MKIEIKSVTITIKWWETLLIVGPILIAIIVAIILAFKFYPGAAWEVLKLWLHG